VSETELEGAKWRVLIADGNTGRGRRLASALSVAGIHSEAVRDGASALDRALSERPALVVAELDLPLVDSEKLSEILRANPRTRSVRFLFLGDRATSSSGGNVGDVLMPLSSRPNDIVKAVEEMLQKQERIDAVEAASAGGGTVEGELSQLSLAELLERFHAGAKSGRLALRRDAEPGRVSSAEITVSEGEVIHAEVGSVENEKALFRLLAWPDGHFVFTPESTDELASIQTATRVLLVEGLRQLAEWDRLAPKLPPLDARVSLRVKRAELPNIVHPLTREVLTLLESYATVNEVMDHSRFPDYQVLRTLHTLAEREIVELGRVPLPEPVLAADEGEALLHEGQGRRLLEWLQGGSPVGLVPRNAKLLVVSSDPDTLDDFVRLIGSIPAVQLSEEWRATADASARDLGVIGRIEVDDKVGIELLHVPLDDRFSPVWSLAGHAALGTLFLLSSSVSEAVGRVRAMTEALRRAPPARLFHVVQFRKDERISPDELRQNVELIDEASLFLLPLESRKAPAALLRRLLARVIP
jgi:CheY-like chemotaxis protein